MLPHPETASVLNELRRQELLDWAARQRLAPRKPTPFRFRPTLRRAPLAGLAALLARPRSWLHDLRGATELEERLPPAV